MAAAAVFHLPRCGAPAPPASIRWFRANALRPRPQHTALGGPVSVRLVREAAFSPGTVLVTGGSGYLGQFLVEDLAAKGWKVGYTYQTAAAPGVEGDVKGFKVNLATGEGLLECFDALGPLDWVINTAANTNPAACESDAEGCRALNIPTKLVNALDRHAKLHGTQPFLVHISTDHVYDGGSSFYQEGAECKPVNVYGRAKLDGELEVQQRWPRHAILRSSIIFGPPRPVRRGLFLQFVDNSLAEKKPTTFFNDEWRTPTYVMDLVHACHAAFALGDALPAPRIFNVGGPERLSRVDMAAAVAEVRGYDPALILPGSAASVPRNCATPADISMDCSLLERELGFKLTPFKEALWEVFAASA